MQDIAGPGRLGPAQLHLGPDHAPGQKRAAFDLQFHRQGGGVPAARGEAGEKALPGGHMVEVKGLRVEGAGKGDGRRFVQYRFAGDKALPARNVIEIKRCSHRCPWRNSLLYSRVALLRTRPSEQTVGPSVEATRAALLRKERDHGQSEEIQKGESEKIEEKDAGRFGPKPQPQSKESQENDETRKNPCPQGKEIAGAQSLQKTAQAKPAQAANGRRQLCRQPQLPEGSIRFRESQPGQDPSHGQGGGTGDGRLRRRRSARRRG